MFHLPNWSRMLLLAAALLPSAAATWAQAYPTRPVQIIVPFSPGAGTDALARIVATGLSAQFGTPVVVENKAGAAGNLGTEEVAKAAPDGHTLLLSGIWLSVNPTLFKRPGFDPLRDFQSISLLATQAPLLVVNPQVEANSVAELVALAKRQPGKLSYASAGVGNQPHLLAEMLKRAAGIDVLHVPYKGGGPAISDVMAGHVSMMFLAPSSSIQHIRTGKLRALAITGTTRSPLLPDVPTFDEAGFPVREFDIGAWWGLSAPAGTPRAVVYKLNAAVKVVLDDPKTRERLFDMGFTPRPGNPGEYDEIVRSEAQTWGRILRESGITAE